MSLSYPPYVHGSWVGGAAAWQPGAVRDAAPHLAPAQALHSTGKYQFATGTLFRSSTSLFVPRMYLCVRKTCLLSKLSASRSARSREAQQRAEFRLGKHLDVFEGTISNGNSSPGTSTTSSCSPPSAQHCRQARAFESVGITSPTPNFN